MGFVPKNFIVGAVIQVWKSVHTVEDVVYFLDKVPCMAVTAQALKTISQGVGDSNGQGLTGFLGNFARELLGIFVLYAKWHWFQPESYKVEYNVESINSSVESSRLSSATPSSWHGEN